MQAVFCCPEQFYFRLDNDYAGRMAAKALMAVLTKDYTVAVRLPPRGKDYNDYLCSGQGISAAKPKTRDFICYAVFDICPEPRPYSGGTSG